MIGRAAPAIAASAASASGSASAGAARAAAASGQTIALLSTPLLEQVRRQAQVHRPRAGPSVAMRIASPMSRPSVAAEVAVHDALVTGAAMSAWRISWKPPRPSSQVAAWPDSSTIGDFGAERRVERADRVGVTRPAGHHRDAGLAR